MVIIGPATLTSIFLTLSLHCFLFNLQRRPSAFNLTIGIQAEASLYPNEILAGLQLSDLQHTSLGIILIYTTFLTLFSTHVISFLEISTSGTILLQGRYILCNSVCPM